MGFKKTSDTIAISFGVAESATNTFIQEEVALQLDVLNNEIFVVLAIDLDLQSPDAVAGKDTFVNASVSTTEATAILALSSTNCLAAAQKNIQAAGFTDSGVAFDRKADSTYTGDVDYIGLIATNNFFVQLKGTDNIDKKAVVGRMWGYRAKADASTYAALVQSEVLSA